MWGSDPVSALGTVPVLAGALSIHHRSRSASWSPTSLVSVIRAAPPLERSASSPHLAVHILSLSLPCVRSPLLLAPGGSILYSLASSPALPATASVLTDRPSPLLLSRMPCPLSSIPRVPTMSSLARPTVTSNPALPT